MRHSVCLYSWQWRVAQQHTHTHTKNALLCFHCYIGYANAPQCYVTPSLLILLHSSYAFLTPESCSWQGMCNFGPLPPCGWLSVLIIISVNSAANLSVHNAEAACSSRTSVWTFNTALCQNRIIQYDVSSVCDVDPHLQFSLLVWRNFLDSGYRRLQGFISLQSSCGAMVVCITGVQKPRALVRRGDLFVFTVAPHICHVTLLALRILWWLLDNWEICATSVWFRVFWRGMRIPYYLQGNEFV